MSVSLREAQMRFAYYVRAVALNRQRLTITEHGRPVAVLAPTSTGAFAGTAERREEVAAGWARRLESVREDLQRRHARDVALLKRELSEVWELLDEFAPRGANVHVDRLRAAQRDLLND